MIQDWLEVRSEGRSETRWRTGAPCSELAGTCCFKGMFLMVVCNLGRRLVTRTRCGMSRYRRRCDAIRGLLCPSSVASDSGVLESSQARLASLGKILRCLPRLQSARISMGHYQGMGAIVMLRMAHMCSPHEARWYHAMVEGRDRAPCRRPTGSVSHSALRPLCVCTKATMGCSLRLFNPHGRARAQGTCHGRRHASSRGRDEGCATALVTFSRVRSCRFLAEQRETALCAGVPSQSRRQWSAGRRRCVPLMPLGGRGEI